MGEWSLSNPLMKIQSKVWLLHDNPNLKGTCSRLRLMFVYKIIWHEILIELLQKVIQKCTNHFRKDWKINRAEITHRSIYFVNIVTRHICLFTLRNAMLWEKKDNCQFFNTNEAFFYLFSLSSNATRTHVQWAWKWSSCLNITSYYRCVKFGRERNCKQTSPIVNKSL